jgi:hypothetical protein
VFATSKGNALESVQNVPVLMSNTCMVILTCDYCRLSLFEALCSPCGNLEYCSFL